MTKVDNEQKKLGLRIFKHKIPLILTVQFRFHAQAEFSETGVQRKGYTWGGDCITT